MKNSIAAKVLSISMSASLLASSMAGPAGASLAPNAPKVPDFVRQLTPPSQLGYLDSFYQGQTAKPVILIQDLHANYGVQQKIAGILNYLEPKIAPAGHPMVVGMEGAWGDIDLTPVRQVAPKVRKIACDFLMKEAEISGMEHFAAMAPRPVSVVGIENSEDYLLHRSLIRKSAAARLRLAHKVEALRQVVDTLKPQATRAIKKVWALEDAFQKGTVDLPELSQSLGQPIHTYGDAEASLYKRKVALAQEVGGQKGFFLRNIVKADQDLALLSRLLRQQLTLEEVQFAANRTPEMLVVVAGLMPGENMKEWKDTINAAIDYYAVALMRDKPLAENALALMNRYPGESIVAVTGGFHTAGITSMLKQKGISYVVLCPVVESHTGRDELLYLQRMLGKDVGPAEIAQIAQKQLNHQTAALRGLYTRAFCRTKGPEETAAAQTVAEVVRAAGAPGLAAAVPGTASRRLAPLPNVQEDGKLGPRVYSVDPDMVRAIPEEKLGDKLDALANDFLKPAEGAMEGAILRGLTFHQLSLLQLRMVGGLPGWSCLPHLDSPVVKRSLTDRCYAQVRVNSDGEAVLYTGLEKDLFQVIELSEGRLVMGHDQIPVMAPQSTRLAQAFMALETAMKRHQVDESALPGRVQIVIGKFDFKSETIERSARDNRNEPDVIQLDESLFDDLNNQEHLNLAMSEEVGWLLELQEVRPRAWELDSEGIDSQKGITARTIGNNMLAVGIEAVLESFRGMDRASGSGEGFGTMFADLLGEKLVTNRPDNGQPDNEWILSQLHEIQEIVGKVLYEIEARFPGATKGRKLMPVANMGTPADADHEGLTPLQAAEATANQVNLGRNEAPRQGIVNTISTAFQAVVAAGKNRLAAARQAQEVRKQRDGLYRKAFSLSA